MKEYEIVAKYLNGCAGEAYPQTSFEEAELGNPDAFTLPRPTVSGSAYDFSFSGLKTAVINLIHNAEQKGITLSKEDVSASFRKAVVGCLTDNLFKAAEDFGAKTIVAAGGVSANSLLRKELSRICSEKGMELYIPDLKLCGDNAAMVGSQAYYEFLSGNIADLDLNATATLPIDYSTKKE